MAVLFGETTITSSAPGMVAKADYSYSRSGTTQNYTITLSIRANSNGAWWNNAWTVRAWINGVNVAYNWVIKNQTSGTINKTWYTKTASFSVNVGSSTGGTVPISIDFYDPGYSGSIDQQGAGNYCGNVSTHMAVNPLPVMSISANSRTTNSVRINYSASGITPSHIHAYNGGTFLGQYSSTPFTISGLSPKTTYSDLHVYGYANGAYGPRSNGISMRTYPNTVSVTSLNVSGITPFEATFTTGTSSTADDDLVEFALCNTSNTVISGPYTSGSYSYNFTGLTPETTYKARTRLRTTDSGAWSAYYYTTFTTLADQASIYFKDSSWKKGKTYMKINNAWVPAKKVYVKDSNTWKGNTNF